MLSTRKPSSKISVRDITRPNHAEAHGIIGDVQGRDCVVWTT